MNEKIISMLIGILIMLGGWSLAKTFTLSTTQAVLDDKVDKLERHVEKLQTQIDNMINMDEEIMEQHEELFKKLQNSGTGYSYN